MELHKHNELYFPPAKAAVLSRHQSEDIKFIDFSKCIKPGQQTSECVPDVRSNFLFSANYARDFDQSG